MVSLRSLMPDLQAETERIKAVRSIRAAIIEGVEAKAELKRMHVLEKLERLHERGARFETDLEADCDKLLERFEEVDAKKSKVFDRRHGALNERESKIDQFDAALDRLDNLGNSQG